MARVSRATAASRYTRSDSFTSKTSRGSRASQNEAYSSIDVLLQQQAEEKKQTCGEWCWSGLKHLFNFTVASCECFTCCCKKHYDDVGDTDSIEDEDIRNIKEKLRFHFMNPFEKWKYPRKRRFPWKLLIQLISIFLVTVQLTIFAHTRFALTNFIEENQSTFTKLFINDPDQPDGDDPLPSPIVTLYTHDDLNQQIQHVVSQYFSLESLALGNYGYGWHDPTTPKTTPHIKLVIEKYNSSSINPAAKVFLVSKGTHNEVKTIYNGTDLSPIWGNIESNLTQIVNIKLRFNISSILYQRSAEFAETKCFLFHVEFFINNDVSTGNMPMTLTVTSSTSTCDNGTDSVHIETGIFSNTGITVLDSLVIFSAVISILQCVRSLFASWKLSREVTSFFREKFDYRLKYHQITPLFNMWFIGVIISNVLVLVGSILKLLISLTVIDSIELVDSTSIIIGLAVFGQWCGLLRFLSYFDKYNMLLITLRLSMPSVIRFVICTGILYIAFLLCGWLVLGPYHPKFRDPTVTSECLFSLVNGDDMFATYKGMSTQSTAAYVFSKIYLYIFIALFIYVVLSVFISLISDTYETLHEHWYERSKGLLMDFASGKLSRAHCHGPGEHHHGPGHSHSHTDLLIEDPKEEQDYVYLQEASNRFTFTEDTPFISNHNPHPKRSTSPHPRNSTSPPPHIVHRDRESLHVPTTIQNRTKT